ncbi:hypothetical protein EVAR_12253_1 [Eumeta japonica]|uniref:Uncharacterized protein n=1 Tax=Eumeta variegata TaxID=151549 RepID=A0A4C1TU46_EUMVA|nr:hypothetical protein EVAR_12253_1 [Eumeta japonica]
MLLKLAMSLAMLHTTYSLEEGYLRYVKDGCFVRGEALSCVKYKALKMATKTIFGFHGNETLRASNMISLVPLDSETLKKSDNEESFIANFNEPRGFMSEWAELTKYAMKLVTDFIKTKALKVNLPEEARAIEEELTGKVGNTVFAMLQSSVILVS